MSEIETLLEELHKVQAKARAQAHEERTLDALKISFYAFHRDHRQYDGKADSWVRGRILQSSPGGHDEFERGMVCLMAPTTRTWRGEIVRAVFSPYGSTCLVPDQHLRLDP